MSNTRDGIAVLVRFPTTYVLLVEIYVALKYYLTDAFSFPTST
jgi:hypothetical protein